MNVGYVNVSNLRFGLSNLVNFTLVGFTKEFLTYMLGFLSFALLLLHSAVANRRGAAEERVEVVRVDECL